jgi:hypothetical protein
MATLKLKAGRKGAWGNRKEKHQAGEGKEWTEKSIKAMGKKETIKGRIQRTQKVQRNWSGSSPSEAEPNKENISSREPSGHESQTPTNGTDMGSQQQLPQLWSPAPAQRNKARTWVPELIPLPWSRRAGHPPPKSELAVERRTGATKELTGSGKARLENRERQTP